MKERIKLVNNFKCIKTNCPKQPPELANCNHYRCMNYGVCQMCIHYNEYTTYCEKKCIYFNQHKGYATTDMTNVEFIRNVHVKEAIKKTHKKVIKRGK